MLIYIGDGSFLPGVPARDLTADEVKAHGGAVPLLASGLYEKDEPPKKETKPVKPTTTADKNEG